MPRPELNTLNNLLRDNTVFSQFMEPLQKVLDDLRHYQGIFPTLTMPLFCMLGCLRHLTATTTLREQVQGLLHLTDEAKAPLARSTWSDALNSETRHDVLALALPKLVSLAQATLPDRLADIPGLCGRSVYAVDGTYQQESSHYKRCTPKQGGEDNPKGHCLLPYFDVRRGIPVDVSVDTTSAHETTVLKNYVLTKESVFHERGALWLADRGFVDAKFWDSLKQAREIEVITRLKENMLINSRQSRPVMACLLNEGVISDELIELNSSSQQWRLVTYKTPLDHIYTYLTNNVEMEPGVIAFLYLRRWDEEKCFDTWKNDFSQKKAWGKGYTAIKSQTVLAIMTSILVALFLNDRQQNWGISDEKSLAKQEKRFYDDLTETQGSDVIKATKPWYLLFYRSVSKVSRQILRFLKSCFLKKASDRLYDSQLKPLLMRYL